MTSQNNTKKQTWTETYKITSYLVNMKGRAGLYAILNLIQDVGWIHAMHLEVQLPKDCGWIFTRQKLQMSKWPKWNDNITIKTWVRPPSPAGFLYRDYELFLEDKKIGECTSTFSVMNLLERKIALMDWSSYSWLWRPDGGLTISPQKIALDSAMEDLAQFHVRNSDLDINNHVNNTKYAQWILDALPLSVIQSDPKLLSYEVNFLAETKSGNLVNVQKSIETQKVAEHLLIKFQGIRDHDKKSAFTAQMEFIE